MAEEALPQPVLTPPWNRVSCGWRHWMSENCARYSPQNSSAASVVAMTRQSVFWLASAPLAHSSSERGWLWPPEPVCCWY